MAYYKYMFVHIYKMKRCNMHSSLKMLSYSINISVPYRFNFTQKLNYSASWYTKYWKLQMNFNGKEYVRDSPKHLLWKIPLDKLFNKTFLWSYTFK